MFAVLMSLWAGCMPATTPVEPDALPGEAVAPPLTVQISSVLAGTPTELRVAGLQPGDRVRFFASLAGRGQGPCAPAGAPCLGILRPHDLGVAQADARGVAVLRAQTPPSPRDVWIQAMRTQPAPGVVTAVLDAHIVAPDTDADGLSDLDEAALQTDPADPDTDGDTLLDGDEVHVHHTDPLLADTDQDLATDARELQLGLDPLDPDMDGDTVRDGIDLRPRQPDVPDPFVVDDTSATAPGVTLPDPEFEPTAGYIVWQDAAGDEVWLAQVDAQTGLFRPSDGRGTLLDTHVGPISIGRNGPEWALSDRGPIALWTRDNAGTLNLARATLGLGGWQVSNVPQSTGQATPIGSLDDADPRPRTIYYADVSPVQTGWRELDNPGTAELTPQFYSFPRWSEGTRVVTGVHDDGTGVRQVFAFDTTTHTETRLTSSPEAKGSTFMWYAPEFGGEQVMFTTHGDAQGNPVQIVLYRNLGGTWTPTLTVPMPPGLPYVISPEPFVHQGRTWVSFVSSDHPLNSDNGVAVIWIASLDPAYPMIRRISRATPMIRKDPESYLGGARPWVYYTLVVGGDNQIRRCELGL